MHEKEVGFVDLIQELLNFFTKAGW